MSSETQIASIVNDILVSIKKNIVFRYVICVYMYIYVYVYFLPIYNLFAKSWI